MLTILRNTLPNAIDTTVFYTFDEVSKLDDTWIITGDIDRMWQRDSCFQVQPYIFLAKNDEKLRAMIRGVINRQMRNAISDPYTCAYNKEDVGGTNPKDKTGHVIDGKLVRERNPNVNSRKYELDSLAAPLYLSVKYFELLDDFSFINARWIQGKFLVEN